MDTTTFFTCLVAVTLLTLTPGVDTMLIIRNSARGGSWDGAVTSLGICTGLFAHATISTLGISLLLLQTAWAFTALKTAGACYLIWLGLGNWRLVINRKTSLGLAAQSIRTKRFKALRSLREGFLSNVLNPKTIVFYMAFLPQFIDPTRQPLLQAMIVAMTHFCVAMFYQCLLASAVDRARYWLETPQVGRVFHLLAGSVMIGIGAQLAFKE